MGWEIGQVAVGVGTDLIGTAVCSGDHNEIGQVGPTLVQPLDPGEDSGVAGCFAINVVADDSALGVVLFRPSAAWRVSPPGFVDLYRVRLFHPVGVLAIVEIPQG